MIVKKQPNAMQLFFVLHGSIIPRIYGKVIAVTLLTAVIIVLDSYVAALPRISMPAMGVFGVALSLFLGFRNNAAYDRWWEARQQWGKIIADVRSLGRHLRAFVGERAESKQILSYLVAFAHLHRGFLRGDDVRTDIADWIGEEHAGIIAAHRNPSDMALRAIADQVHVLAEDGALSGFGQMTISQTLSSIGLAQAANERICTTPMPFVYSLLVRRTTYLYCGLLPFALIGATNWFAPLFAAVVAYVFFGLQAVTNELEQPFHDTHNGLPLNALCRTIEISVCEALDLPAPEDLSPQNSVLR